jgi:DNA-binding response OmpR family regulator
MILPCVLLIDDDIKLLVKMESALQQAGYRVLTAHNDRQAVYLAQAALPDAIVCDAAMTSVDGLEVKQTLARNSQTATIPFLFFNRSDGPNSCLGHWRHA